jgi:ubiquinone/menaquinone biosynthesis C-methylase UbiE
VDHFKRIYTGQAAAYQRMISAEDTDSNLGPALERVAPFKGKRLLDLGTGTGRIPLLVGQYTGHLVGLDLHAAMLEENKRQREEAKGRWRLVQGDMRFLPFPAGWAEVITAGWAIGHVRTWFDRDWQAQVGQILAEMHRLIASGGTLIILETLTTGGLKAEPPSAALAGYYTWLENEWDFTWHVVSTDFQFATVEEAVARTEFFFGPEMAAKIELNAWNRLPEWTGLWSKRV